LSRTRCSVLHAAPQSRDPDAANWVPALLVQKGITVTKSLQYSFIIAFAYPYGAHTKDIDAALAASFSLIRTTGAEWCLK
jgi:hypothetical protein